MNLDRLGHQDVSEDRRGEVEDARVLPPADPVQGWALIVGLHAEVTAVDLIAAAEAVLL
jgi:hypothetical protein